MLDAKIHALRHHTHHIEPHLHVQIVQQQIVVCGLHRAPDFGGRNGIFRVFEKFSRARFHLHYHQHAVFFCHNIEFVFATAPVAVEQRVTLVAQVGLRLQFALAPKIVVFCHCFCLFVWHKVTKKKRFRQSFPNFRKKLYFCKLNHFFLMKKKSLPRTHRVSFMLNDEEKRIIDHYIEKYGVSNVSKFMREAVVRTVLKRLDEDRPTLFD